MKKSLLALAVLGAFASAASAQSSVTLSGSIDVGVRRDGPTDDWQVVTAGSGRSQITFAGTEDLGGGMRAFFHIQHRFRPNDGAINQQNAPGESGTQFWRQTWVGLGGGFGDVRLGRMLTPQQELNGGYDAFGTDTVGSVHAGGSSRIIRANNTVYYRTPNFGGFQGHASISEADGQYPAVGSERPAGLAVQYAAGPLAVGAAWDRDEMDLKGLGLYARYDFGVAAVFGQFERIDRTATNEHNTYSVSTRVPFGPAVLKAGVRRINADINDASETKLGLGVDYNMSKRTTLYADMGKLSGDNVNTGASLTSQQKKASFDFGIHHRF